MRAIVGVIHVGISAGALRRLTRVLDFPGVNTRPIRRTHMSDEMKCKFCFGTGQKIEMTPVRLGEKLPPELRRDRCSTQTRPCPSSPQINAAGDLKRKRSPGFTPESPCGAADPSSAKNEWASPEPVRIGKSAARGADGVFRNGAP
jgi:hypothetical protein